jgi:phosphate transport system permease protein
LVGKAADEAVLQRWRGSDVSATGAPIHTPADVAAWRLRDRLGLAFAWFIGLLFCVVCGAIVIFLVVQGIRYLRPDMLWTNPKVGFNENETGGFLAEIIGTVLVTGAALVIAVPVGVGVAVWLTEYGRPTALARVVESTVEMFAGAPSIVLALFGVVVFQAPFLAFLSATTQGHAYGKSFFAAGSILSLLALPIIVANVREGLRAIPNHVREASYALGKTKITTIRRVLLPAARPSVITGTMIGAGHVIGDTAIIVFLLGSTYTLQAVGGVPLLNVLRGTDSTLTSFIYNNAPTGELNQPQKAYAAAVVLLAIVFLLNVVVDISGRKARDLKWT